MSYPVQQPAPMSLDDFEELLADQPEGERWELICGRVVRMMVGARWEHNLIIGNIAGGLNRRFREGGSRCRALTESFRLKEASSPSSLLPDVLIFCTKPASGATSLDDATVLFEVLSPGTQRRDREEKWFAYQRLPSLKHYLLVSRDTPRVQCFDRDGSNWSGLRLIDGLEAELGLPALGVTMPMREIYADVLD